MILNSHLQNYNQMFLAKQNIFAIIPARETRDVIIRRMMTFKGSVHCVVAGEL